MTVVAVGLDIGATKTLGVAVDRTGAVLAELREPTIPGAEGIVTTAAGVVEELLAATHAPTALWPIGVGVPGLVDAGSGSVKYAINLGLDGEWLPLRDRLQSRIGQPVIVENDVNAAALGATALFHSRQGAMPRDLAYLSLGTGLAAGLVLNGQPRRGVHGAAGEIGHIPVDPGGLWCPCGQRGCLETVASGSALAAGWPAASGTAPATALFDAAAAGDPKAIAVRDQFASAVAAAVRMLCLIVDVDAVVLGGGVAEVGAPLQAAVTHALRDQARASPFLHSLDLAERLSVVPQGYPVAAVGAALMGRPAVAVGPAPVPSS